MQEEVSHSTLGPRRLEKTGTPGVYKRGSRYVVVFRDQTGRQVKRAARTLAEARELKATLTADVKRGEYQAVSKVPFIEYAQEWVETYAGRTSRGFREVTRDDYRRRLGLDTKGNPAGEGAVSFFGRTPLSAITPRDLKRFAESLRARARPKHSQASSGSRESPSRHRSRRGTDPHEPRCGAPDRERTA
jgi:hypothetical protein